MTRNTLDCLKAVDIEDLREDQKAYLDAAAKDLANQIMGRHPGKPAFIRLVAMYLSKATEQEYAKAMRKHVEDNPHKQTKNTNLFEETY